MRWPGQTSCRVQAPPTRVAGLEHQHALARTGQVRRARQAVVPRTHDHVTSQRLLEDFAD